MEANVNSRVAYNRLSQWDAAGVYARGRAQAALGDGTSPREKKNCNKDELCHGDVPHARIHDTAAATAAMCVTRPVNKDG